MAKGEDVSLHEDSEPAPNGRKRSPAWFYYGVVAILCLVATPMTGGVSLKLAPLFAAYAVYLYMGGKFVIWFV